MNCEHRMLSSYLSVGTQVPQKTLTLSIELMLLIDASLLLCGWSLFAFFASNVRRFHYRLAAGTHQKKLLKNAGLRASCKQYSTSVHLSFSIKPLKYHTYSTGTGTVSYWYPWIIMPPPACIPCCYQEEGGRKKSHHHHHERYCGTYIKIWKSIIVTVLIISKATSPWIRML